MKRGLIVFAGIVVLGIAAFFVSRSCLLPGSPTKWLCREYSLSSAQAERMESLEKEYGIRCGPYCDAMCAANAALETAALGSGSVTPALRSAVAETDRIRTETRIAMLEHFYAVAAELPPEQRRNYLLKVLPLVIDSCGTRR